MKHFTRLLVKQCVMFFSVVLLSWPLLAAPEAPNFSLQDSQGNQVQLSDYKGKPVILHFWATWCPYCKKVQPGLDKLYQAHKKEGLVLLGVSFREDEGAKPQEVLDARGMSFKTLINGEKVAARYGVRGTPTTMFIDRKGQAQGVTQTSNPKDPGLVRLTDLILKK